MDGSQDDGVAAVSALIFNDAEQDEAH